VGKKLTVRLKSKTNIAFRSAAYNKMPSNAGLYISRKDNEIIRYEDCEGHIRFTFSLKKQNLLNFYLI